MLAKDSKDLFYSNLGKVVSLMGHSSLHKGWPTHLVRQYVDPALRLGQYLILENIDGAPLAYVSWAFLTIEAEGRYLENPHALGDLDWAGGSRAWLTNFISPFHSKFTLELINRLKRDLFPKEAARALRVKPSSNVSRVTHYWGVDVGLNERRLAMEHFYQTARHSTKSGKIIWQR